MQRARPLLVVLIVAAGCRGARKTEPHEPPQPLTPETANERRPDPDYPTAAMAGTEELFLIEEPPRGPHVTNVRLPDRSRLRFSEHAHCELAPARLVCAPTRPKPGAA